MRKAKKEAIKSIRTVSEYKAYADNLKLTMEQRQIFDMIFINGWNYGKISDEMGYTEATIKTKVKTILDFI